MVISLVINQANPMPTSRFKKVSQNPCDSLRDVVYVDVLSIVRDKMCAGRTCRHSSWIPESMISARTAESVPAFKGLERPALAFIHTPKPPPLVWLRAG